jgi:molybdopterin-guanine dinucleotide biosynthesis protein
MKERGYFTMTKVIAMGGEPATGKTTLMFKLISMANDWKVSKPQKLLDVMYSEKLNLYVLGKYENDGNIFQGTDRLSMAVQPDADKFFTDMASKDYNVIFEGDRIFNAKMLERLGDLFPESFKILILESSEEEKHKRHVDRKDDQDDKFKNSRATKISNIRSSLVLMDYIDVFKNENLVDQQNIINTIKTFYNWSE